MKRFIALALVAFVFTGCASTTVIKSNPSGATVYDVYGQELGKTPYVHEDMGIINNKEWFTVELEGYEPQDLRIRRSKANSTRIVGFGVGGLFIPPLWAGLLWATDYAPVYEVELDKADVKPSRASR